MQTVVVDIGIREIDGNKSVFVMAPELQCWGSGSNRAYVDLHDAFSEDADRRKNLHSRLFLLKGLHPTCIKKKVGWNALVIGVDSGFKEDVAIGNMVNLLSSLFGCNVERGYLSDENMMELFTHPGEKVKVSQYC